MVKTGKLDGCALESEKSADEYNIDGNILIVPPLAWNTQDSLRRNTTQWVQAIVEVADGVFIDRVN